MVLFSQWCFSRVSCFCCQTFSFVSVFFFCKNKNYGHWFMLEMHVVLAIMVVSIVFSNMMRLQLALDKIVFITYVLQTSFSIQTFYSGVCI